MKVETFNGAMGAFLMNHVAPALAGDLQKMAVGFIARSRLVANLINHPMAGLLGVLDAGGEVDLKALRECVGGAFNAHGVLDLGRFGVPGKGLTVEDFDVLFDKFCAVAAGDAAK